MDKYKNNKGHNRKRKKYVALLFLLIAFILAGVIETTAESADPYFSDESGMLQDSIKKKLDMFHTEHKYSIVVFARKKSMKETQQNHLEDALRVFEQQKRKIGYIPENKLPLPAFLLYYNVADRVFVITQQKDKVLQDEKIQAIQSKYSEQKRALKTIPLTEEDEIKKSANTLMTLLLADLMEEIDKKEQEEKQLEQQRRQEGGNLCPPVKDGICNRSCRGLDLDCLCGDGICQYHENSETCTTDCGGKRSITCSIITDGLCSGNCVTKDIDCYFEELAERAFRYGETKKISAKVMTKIFLALVVLFSLIFLILIQIMHLKHEKERQKQMFGKEDFIQRLLRYQEKESEQMIKRDIKDEKKENKKNDRKSVEKEKR